MKKVLIAMFITGSLMAVMLPASARTASDPTGDVAGILDISGMTTTTSSKAIVMKLTMAAPVASSLLESPNGGTIFITLLTRRSATSNYYNYLNEYDIDVSYSGGSLYAGLRGGVVGEAEFIDYIPVSRPDSSTFKVTVPRRFLVGDRDGARFGYWFQTSYSSMSVCGGVCVDFAPDGDEIYQGRF